MFFIAAPVVPVVDLACCWERARLRVGVKHEVLAALCGVPATQLSAQLRGKGHPSLWRLLMPLLDVDGRRFVWAFFDEIAVAAGRDDDALALLQQAEAALLRERRMVKADLPTRMQERRSA